MTRPALLAMLLLSFTGCPSGEGAHCDTGVSPAECMDYGNRLVCFYGTCRDICGPSFDPCPSGKVCTTTAGWEPVISLPTGMRKNINNQGPNGVCLTPCHADSECTGLRSCNPVPSNPEAPDLNQSGALFETCAPRAGICAADGFCHAACSADAGTYSPGCGVGTCGPGSFSAAACSDDVQDACIFDAGAAPFCSTASG